MRLHLAALCASLAACTLPETPQTDCGAAALQDLIGEPVTAFYDTGRTGPVRVLRPDQAMTLDYSAERLNLLLDPAGRIQRISCG